MTSIAHKNELLIWWTTHGEACAIGYALVSTFPAYVREQFQLRRAQYQQNPSKALFVDNKFGAREITDWPDTNIARMLRDDTSQGIVFAGRDLQLFKDVPGLVTDFRLHLLVI